MNRVTTEIAQKIAVLLQDRDANPRPGEKKPEHHPSGPSADYDAGRLRDSRRIHLQPESRGRCQKAGKIYVRFLTSHAQKRIKIAFR
jgi:hypothetical protein